MEGWWPIENGIFTVPLFHQVFYYFIMSILLHYYFIFDGTAHCSILFHTVPSGIEKTT